VSGPPTTDAKLNIPTSSTDTRESNIDTIVDGVNAPQLLFNPPSTPSTPLSTIPKSPWAITSLEQFPFDSDPNFKSQMRIKVKNATSSNLKSSKTSKKASATAK
jgi:hypothetical protein